jgi:hypothetical protein
MAFPGAEVSEGVAEGYETRPYQIRDNGGTLSSVVPIEPR